MISSAASRTILLRRAPLISRPYSQSQPLAVWKGSSSADNTNERGDELDVQNEVSEGGKREKAGKEPHQSAAAVEKDPGNSNKKAKKENPESPAVIGMQDERGSKGDQ